ncbi:MAG: hypothetical protein ABR599_00180 [Gemmatimonadota bacterium]
MIWKLLLALALLALAAVLPPARLAAQDAAGALDGPAAGGVAAPERSAGSSLLDSLDAAAPLPIAEVRLSPADTMVASGERMRFVAVAIDSAGAPIPDVEFFWGADPGLVADVDSTGALLAGEPMQGLVVARPIGASVVGVARVIVLPPPVVELRVEGPREVVAGAYVPVVAVGTDRTGATRPLPEAVWTSSAPAVAEVQAGRLLARAPGRVTLTAASGAARGSLELRVTRNPATALEIGCGACGEDVRRVAGGTLRLPVGEAVRLVGRARGLEGDAPVRWWLEGEGASVDPRGFFVADRPGRYVVLSQMGGLTARQVLEAAPREARGVFRLVGRGPVSSPRASDLWVFEGLDGRDYAYTGSIGGDQVKIWDVTDPAHPVQTDSLVVDARVVNDVNLNASRRLGVLTREGATDRRNGIVFFDASDPAHPKVVSEYTETVTSGVHNAFFEGDYVYATNDGTRALHVISAKDPRNPIEVARWELRPGRTDKYLHDVIVQDGLAYLSYWDDGLVILDVGNGVEGGSPENPVFVSRIAYPEGHTHTAWRWKNWVFTGDEIFGGPPVSPTGGVPGGFLHVIDVTDLEHPEEVAWYEVPGAGAHNVWMDEENEILFVSYYNAGVRALDVSGNLRGDLMAQGRELAYFLTGEPDPEQAFRPNSPMNWGPQLFKGHVFSTDQNSGLWVLRYEPRPDLAGAQSAPGSLPARESQ